MKRSYSLEFTTHGYRPLALPWPQEVTSNAPLRTVTAVMFRRVFGRSPDRDLGIWKSFGFARDRRGNQLMVTQINHDDLPGFDTRTGRFPLAVVAAGN